MKKIKSIINQYRIKESNYFLLKNISHISIFSISILILMIFLERTFYLEPKIRTSIYHIYLFLISTSLLYSIILWMIHKKSLFNYKNDFDIAKQIARKNGIIKDQLINTLEINKDKNPINVDLKNHAIKQLEYKLDKNLLIGESFVQNKKTTYYIFLLFSLFAICLLSSDFRFALKRIANHKTIYNPPTPFILSDLTNNFSILQGDTLKIKISSSGDIPDSIDFFWENKKKTINEKISHEKGIYKTQLPNVKQDILYWAEYKNPHFFSPWKIISTKKNAIEVKSRPNINNITFNIDPPDYSNINPYNHNQSNVNQIDILKGSIVSINAKSDKLLSSAWILINEEERIPLKIIEKNISQTIKINDDTSIKIYCLDNEMIPNLNPMQYTFIAKNDMPPNIVVQSPELQFELNESLSIPLKFNIYDDYGINDVWIEYKVVSKDFPELKNNIKKVILKKENTSNNLSNMIYDWNINSIGILMGDELHFWISASDYDNINGPNIGKSQTIIGIFPSLEDLFFEVEEYENSTEDIVNEIQDSMEDISDITEEIKLELLKKDDLTWEQEKKLEQTFEEVNEAFQQIEEMQKNIDKITEQASKNNLFNEELLEKFDQFKDMLQNIMTPELMDAMAELQEAFKNFDKEKMLKALENYEFNIEKFEEELDRFIDMFELALAEQKLNELSKEVENMINKQTDLIDEINNKQDQMVLEKKSIKQENRFDSFMDQINEAKQAMENISQDTSDKLNQLSESSLAENTKNNLGQQTQDIKNNNNEKIMEQTNKTKDNLEEIQSMISEINNQFQNESINKMTKEFIMIIDNLLTMSNQQEEIIISSKGLRSSNPQLKIINQNQNNIDRQLNQITKQLISLSNKTFFINPKINRIIGKLKTAITKAISSFEQKKISDAKKNQLKILKNINEVTFLLLLSMDEMQNSDSTSGFENFLQSLGEMSQQQEGINNQTMQLGQMGMMMQQSMMQQLMQQQQELKNKLSEMLGDMPGQNLGGLSQANKDMEEIIQDFKNKNINRETINRQERILSRMLDSQKSMTKKDFSEKRRGTVSNDAIFSGPGNLPENMGEKDLLLINAMESAIKEGHSLEYQKLIRTYFLNLQKEANYAK